MSRQRKRWGAATGLSLMAIGPVAALAGWWAVVPLTAFAACLIRLELMNRSGAAVSRG